MEAARTSRESSESLLRTQEEELQKANLKLEQLRVLVADGLVARNELVKEEENLIVLEGSVAATRQQIKDSELFIAGLLKAEETAKQPQQPTVTKYRSYTGPTMLRYGGTSGWTLNNLSQIQSFYSTKFGHAMPTSAVGQSTTHNRLGWNHRHAVDVPVHPDSTEGKALMAYLQSQGIPFSAFRGAVPGVSTGPHIHIGSPSPRL